MSRSGYNEDCDDPWASIMWRGQVASATRGRRGQRMFRDLKAALEAMPRKRLINGELLEEGEVCALGALGRARGLEIADLDPYDQESVAETFDVARQLACEVAYENDEGGSYRETPEERWARMHVWVCSQIRGEK